MRVLSTGNAQTDWELADATPEQVKVDADNLSFTLTADAYLQAIVQVGTAANPLTGGGFTAITLKITPPDTSDEGTGAQKTMNVPVGVTSIGLESIPRWVASGSIVKVFLVSSTGGDVSVGGVARLVDLSSAGSSPDAIAAAVWDALKSAHTDSGSMGQVQGIQHF